MICNGIINQSVSSRNAYSLVNIVGKISGNVYIVKNNRSANAKSLLGILSLSLCKGDEVEVCISDNEETEARQMLREFIQF